MNVKTLLAVLVACVVVAPSPVVRAQGAEGKDGMLSTFAQWQRTGNCWPTATGTVSAAALRPNPQNHSRKAAKNPQTTGLFCGCALLAYGW